MYQHVEAVSRRRRTLVLTTVVAVIVAIIGFATPASAASDDDQTFRVTVENLTENQTITPAVVTAHESSFSLFEANQPATHGLGQLAENGGVPVLVDELWATPEVADVAVAGAAPIAPGEAATSDIVTSGDARFISVAAMLICTNDGFGAVTGIGTQLRDGVSMTYGRSYDAGTEVNTQDFDDLVPPCSGIPGVGTGESNPALAENGVVRHHKGITNRGDLTSATHGWDDPVIRVTVEKVSTFDVTITNLTAGQPITPGVFAAHAGEYSLFSNGTAATNGLQQLAENGGVPILAAEVAADASVVASTVVGAVPIAPGGSASGSIEVVGDATKFSLAAMLVCTNDGFGGIDGRNLPGAVGAVASYGIDAYDAGTEINTEAFVDLVPPCDGDLGTGTGMSNPALSEGGTVHPHAGIAGIADLTHSHDWSGPVMSISVERTS